MRRHPSWGRRAVVLVVVVQALALPAGASANYGGNSYGNEEITIIVVAIMAAVALGWAIWYSIRKLGRARADRSQLNTAAATGNAADYMERRNAKAMASANTTAEFVQEMRAKAARGEFNVDGAPLVIGHGASPPDVADELTKLADLRDRGVLTEAEFEAQKAKLLAAG